VGADAIQAAVDDRSRRRAGGRRATVDKCLITMVL
jgi:hypothetical protein